MSESTPAATTTTDAAYFDGRSARPRPVTLEVASGRLLIVGDGVSLQLALADVRWPERTRHGPRVAHLRDGGSLQAQDPAAWDQWAQATGLRESLVVKAQQNWRGTLIAVLALLVLGVAAYLWGVPWLGRSALAAVPESVDRAVGDVAQQALDRHLLLPSDVPAQRRLQVRELFASAVARADPQHRLPTWELHFATSAVVSGSEHSAKKERGEVGKGEVSKGEVSKGEMDEGEEVRRTRLGPNAFALPGGIIYVTDEMLDLLRGRDDVLIGVLAHELGHVKRRHGMRLLVQATVLGAVTSLVWGDFSSLLATVPVLLGQSAYSRDFEREADVDAAYLLRANGISPAVMVELFERMAAMRAAQASAASGAAAKDGAGERDLGIAFASHPDDAERIRRFRDAAR